MNTETLRKNTEKNTTPPQSPGTNTAENQTNKIIETTETKQKDIIRRVITRNEVSPQELEKTLMKTKTFTAHYTNKKGEVITYRNLHIEEFRDLHGYGFKLPDGRVLIISKYDRRNKEPATYLKNWKFKTEQ